MPTPFADFETNFRSAETLLKVYRLLDTQGKYEWSSMSRRMRKRGLVKKGKA